MEDVTLASVIVCTHNPRPDYFRRVLDAVRAQTLPKNQWELLLVDNASDTCLANSWDVSWHPRARIVRENQIGLTPARIRGIVESSGDLFVFVDDDNVIAQEYLTNALQIGAEYPHLGCWGGSIQAEFETEPPSWANRYLPLLALHTTKTDRWSNTARDSDTIPRGAGLCVRKTVALKWRDAVVIDKARFGLGRSGETLHAAEDWDLAFTACDLGLGTGIFVRLVLRHLIPKERLTVAYFENLARGMEYSHVILQSLRDTDLQRARESLLRRLIAEYRIWRLSPQQRRIERARRAGRERAYSQLQLG